MPSNFLKMAKKKKKLKVLNQKTFSYSTEKSFKVFYTKFSKTNIKIINSKINAGKLISDQPK